MKITSLLQTNTGKAFILTSLSFPLLSNTQLSLLIFLGAFVMDFLTGVLASYIEVKNKTRELPKSGYILESSRARETVVKGIGYTIFIMSALGLEYLFFDKAITLGSLSSKSFGLVDLAIGFCAIIEIYSTLIENLKRCGWDLIGKAQALTTTVWDLINKVKGNG